MLGIDLRTFNLEIGLYEIDLNIVDLLLIMQFTAQKLMSDNWNLNCAQGKEILHVIGSAMHGNLKTRYLKIRTNLQGACLLCHFVCASQ